MTGRQGSARTRRAKANRRERESPAPTARVADTGADTGAADRRPRKWPLYNSGTISNATMLMILISGLTAGPAVSL
jgi:hypothetical protein